MPPRNTFQWYREMILLSTVFAITGSSTMFLVRPAVSEVLGLQGSMKDGPWSYRIARKVFRVCIVFFLTCAYVNLATHLTFVCPI